MKLDDMKQFVGKKCLIDFGETAPSYIGEDELPMVVTVTGFVWPCDDEEEEIGGIEAENGDFSYMFRPDEVVSMTEVRK